MNVKVLPLPELALDPDPPAVELHEPLREREAEAGPFALLDPRLGLLELLEDPLPILGAIPGPVSATETLHLAVRPASRVTSTSRRRA